MLSLQGYGHIGRETARLLKAFNVDVIVANSNGERREDDGVSAAARRIVGGFRALCLEVWGTGSRGLRAGDGI
jgi:lactate dehydrogenase-like 2-hydroxyacid dehydrogenase